MIEIGNGGGSDAPLTSVSRGLGPMWPWAVDPKKAGNGWSMGHNGSVMVDGLCLTAGSLVELTPCLTGSAGTNQQFTLEANGNMHLTAKKTDCLALQGGRGPALTMAPCKQGSAGANEEFSLTNGQLCSHALSTSASLHNSGAKLCLKAEASKPSAGSHGGGGGFDCGADQQALARCRVHFTMWTIMKAPLLLGNDIRKIDNVTLAILKNQDAIAISQDSLGVQARRLWSQGKADDVDPEAGSAAAVASPCSLSRPTQVWQHDSNGVIKTVDKNGQSWCLHDVEGLGKVGDWRAISCSPAIGTPLKQLRSVNDFQNVTALVTPSGEHLTIENKFGASGPVAHSRYLETDRTQSASSTWHVLPVIDEKIRFMVRDRKGVRDDDKQGSVSQGGDWCLDIVADMDSEVWAGPLANKKWAVALLNRHTTTTAVLTVNYTMFNMSSAASYSVRDIWAEAEVGTHVGRYSASVAPQSVVYLVLTPA